jgi:2'-5' RNA ligase
VIIVLRMNAQLALFDLPETRSARPAPVLPRSLSPYEEYLFFLVMAPEIVDDVKALKNEFGALFGEFSSRWSVGHITLAMARMARSDERLLLDLINTICRSHSAFPLHFSGFDHFLENRTIFIDPIEKEPIIHLGMHIEQALRSASGFKRLGVRATHWPHMTVLKGLFRKGQFKTAWEMLQARNYERAMLAERVVVFRRPNRKSRCTFVGAFPLAE